MRQLAKFPPIYIVSFNLSAEELFLSWIYYTSSTLKSILDMQAPSKQENLCPTDLFVFEYDGER